MYIYKYVFFILKNLVISLMKYGLGVVGNMCDIIPASLEPLIEIYIIFLQICIFYFKELGDWFDEIWVGGCRKYGSRGCRKYGKYG